MRQILTAHNRYTVTEISETVSDLYNHPEGVADAFIELAKLPIAFLSHSVVFAVAERSSLKKCPPVAIRVMRKQKIESRTPR